MDDDVFELYALIIDYVEEIPSYRVPRIDGVDSCCVRSWRLFERPCEWLFTRDRRNKQRKVGNDK